MFFLKRIPIVHIVKSSLWFDVFATLFFLFDRTDTFILAC